MFSPTVTRRLLLVALVLATVLVAFGCASSQPIADRGTVLLTWRVGPVSGNRCGWAQEVAPGNWLVTFRRRYSFDDPCVIHELTHVFGGDHP